MCLVLADSNESALKKSVEEIKGVSGVGQVMGVHVDVGDVKAVERLRDTVFDEFGEVRVFCISYYSSVHRSLPTASLACLQRNAGQQAGRQARKLAIGLFINLSSLSSPSSLHRQVQVLLNNAGISKPCPAFSLDKDLASLQENWHAVLNTNFFGQLNVAQAFAPSMARSENYSVIINTGSKQGITCPP